MARSSVKGAASLRRALRRMPDEMRAELGDEMNVIAQRLLGRAKAEVPVRTGRLRSMLAAKVLPKSLQLRLGLVTKAKQRKGFYGYILDQGRKAQTVRAKRRSRVSGVVSSFLMKISPISRERYNFVFGRRADFIANDLPRLRDALIRVLGRAARGDGE